MANILSAFNSNKSKSTTTLSKLFGHISSSKKFVVTGVTGGNTKYATTTTGSTSGYTGVTGGNSKYANADEMENNYNILTQNYSKLVEVLQGVQTLLSSLSDSNLYTGTDVQYILDAASNAVNLNSTAKDIFEVALVDLKEQIDKVRSASTGLTAGTVGAAATAGLAESESGSDGSSSGSNYSGGSGDTSTTTTSDEKNGRDKGYPSSMEEYERTKAQQAKDLSSESQKKEQLAAGKYMQTKEKAQQAAEKAQTDGKKRTEQIRAQQAAEKAQTDGIKRTEQIRAQQAAEKAQTDGIKRTEQIKDQQARVQAVEDTWDRGTKNSNVPTHSFTGKAPLPAQKPRSITPTSPATKSATAGGNSGTASNVPSGSLTGKAPLPAQKPRPRGKVHVPKGSSGSSGKVVRTGSSKGSLGSSGSKVSSGSSSSSYTKSGQSKPSVGVKTRTDVK